MGTLGTGEKERGATKGTAAAKPEMLARSLYENFNAGNVEKSTELIADDGEWVDVPSGATFKGPKGYVDFWNGWKTAFPDGKVEITNVVCQGDVVMTEFTGHGTQTGPFTGAKGTVPASGKKVELKCLEVMQCRDGKIVRGRMYYDSGTLMKQIGAM
jgi:steroid delta-isomerase-like uncharacterized protein